MPLLNFKTRFVEPIRSGRKGHTIRGDRKIPIEVGDKLYLYCGARTKNCFRILPDPVTCTKLETIEIIPALDLVTNPIRVEHQVLSLDECALLALADGFTCFADMMRFWEGRLPFKGQIIHWRIQ